MTTTSQVRIRTDADVVAPLHQVVVKAASSCNLNCTYCYVYNKGDATWASQPRIMSDLVYMAMLERIRRHCAASGQREVNLTFHGGEPTLVGPERFDDWCSKAHSILAEHVEVHIDIQTNGTLLSPAWMDVFLTHKVEVGLSSDGPKSIHDVYRLDHRGRGSYDRFEQGALLLKESGVPFGILAVIQLGHDPVEIHRHFLSLGCNAVGYLLPAETHETVGPILERFGPTPCADYLIPVFDEWWEYGTTSVPVREFWNMATVIMGGQTRLDSIGNPPIRFVGVQPNGAMEGLDKLRICRPGLADIGVNVLDSDFAEIDSLNTFHGEIMSGVPLPGGCAACPERSTCGGGYLPNRFSEDRGFDNPSVWCADLLKLFGHIRDRMGITIDETARLRKLRLT